MTNQQKFIEIFGKDAWLQMIVFMGIADQYKEYWTSPYLEQPDKCKFLKDADCCYPIDECIKCPNHKKESD